MPGDFDGLGQTSQPSGRRHVEVRFPIVFHVAAWMIVITIGLFWIGVAGEKLIRLATYLATNQR